MLSEGQGQVMFTKYISCFFLLSPDGDRDNTVDRLLNGVSGEKISTLNPGGGAEGCAGPLL